MTPGLIVDLFAGGGGASMGIELALGRSPDVAVNHDAVALAVHRANHPGTRHYQADVFEVDPVEATGGLPVGLLWASPDCKHFSKAKGGRPVEKKIRSLAWVAVKWAATARPAVIILENVEEFVTWGPLGGDGRPCPLRKGRTFRAFVRRLEAEGYQVEHRELRACDYGAPTTRKRLFLIARRDGLPIAWPEPTHGPGRGQPWRTAAECIDWSIPCPSIFDRARPLAEATLRRIARGVMRYVVGAAKPFIVRTDMHLSNAGCVYPTDDPLRTVTSSGGLGLVVPSLIQTGYGERPGQAPRALDLGQPLGTVVGCGQKHALVAAFLAKHYGGPGGNQTPGAPLDQPAPTVTGTGQIGPVAVRLTRPPEPGPGPSMVAAFLQSYYRTGTDRSIEEPAPTITTKDRLGLVTVEIEGETYAIADIGMRMLQPRELARAQGFPDSYALDRGADGKEITKTAQVRLVGNSVCPPIAAALVRANCAELAVGRGQLRMWGEA